MVVGEGVSLRWLDSGGVGEWQGEGAVVEVDRWGTGLPFQALEGAMKNKKKNGDESQALTGPCVTQVRVSPGITNELIIVV